VGEPGEVKHLSNQRKRKQVAPHLRSEQCDTNIPMHTNYTNNTNKLFVSISIISKISILVLIKRRAEARSEYSLSSGERNGKSPNLPMLRIGNFKKQETRNKQIKNSNNQN